MAIFDSLIDFEYKNGISITGLTTETFGILANSLVKKQNRNILIVTSSLYEANQIYSSIESYTENVYLFPMDDFLTSEAIAISPELEIIRLETLNETLKNNTNNIYITNLMGYMRFLPSKRDFVSSILKVEVGNEISPSSLVQKLIASGYHRETLVTKTGEIGIRGFVIDVFPIGEDYPIRIEFFGDEIESIRYFDINTQISKNSVQSIIIKPVSEFITSKEVPEEFRKQKYLPNYVDCVSSFSDYIDNKIVIYKDYNQLETYYTQNLEEILTYRTAHDSNFDGQYMFDFPKQNEMNKIYYYTLNNILPNGNNDLIDFKTSSVSCFFKNVESINEYIRNQIEIGKTIIMCLSKKQSKSVSKYLNVNVYMTDEDNIYKNKVNIIEKELNEGFVYEDYVVLTANELFSENNKNKSIKTKFKYGTKIKNINNLEVGDYVVHNIHGIGIYNGIKVLTTNNISKDYIEVLYGGNDKLYIPVEKIELLTKYVGKEGYKPKINKMDSIEWQKTKSRVSTICRKGTKKGIPI